MRFCALFPSWRRQSVRRLVTHTRVGQFNSRAGGAFTVASLEAAHRYGVAMEQQFAGKMQDALRTFSNAVQLDPNFARAYSGMAGAYRNLGQQKDAKKYIKMAMAHVDRLTERERYRLRGLSTVSTGTGRSAWRSAASLLIGIQPTI